MPSNRAYKKCHKCGNNTIGRYTDEQGNYICSPCMPYKLRKKTSPCIKCGGGQMGINDDVYKCPIILGNSGDDNSIALFLSLFIISYTYHMSFKRVFLTCHKCSKDCIGKYRDDDGNPLCGTCIPNNQRSRMVSCSKCNSGHHDTTGTNICRKCRSMEAQRSPNVRLCPTCGGRINSKLETMTECMKCMGKPKYWRLLRASKKQET